jgi:nucleoid-associated protein Lsr2
MAQVVTRELIDDIDESPAERTFTFAIEGKAFEVDLSLTNIAGFHEAVARYVENARSVGRVAMVAKSGGNGAARVDREQSSAVREWARKNGYEVSDRGRIAATVQTAFDEAHRAGTGS